MWVWRFPSYFYVFNFAAPNYLLLYHLFDSFCDMGCLLYRSVVCILLYRCFVIFVDTILELYFMKDRMLVVLNFLYTFIWNKGLIFHFVFFNLIMLINIFILLCPTFSMVMIYIFGPLVLTLYSTTVCRYLIEKFVGTYPVSFYSIWMLQKHIGVMQYAFNCFWWLDSFNCAVCWHTLVPFTSNDFWVCMLAF